MTQLHLCTPDDLPRLMPLVAAFHAEYGLDLDDAHREAALMPLLEGSPHGAAWLIGPARAPVGYVVACFGWAIELGGLDGFVDELYIRPAVRGRGLASEALGALGTQLAGHGLKAFHLEVDRDDVKAQGFYKRLGYELRDRYALMSRYFRAPPRDR
ncbi:MAG: putative acetyltransferase [Rhodobacteraceae bacterium HLUCCA08]|nr:MAG: putative acetyltransferase [Rhodobacteraceae bacterium HLUCCA08]